jgi:hypothetical protein
MFAKSNSLFFSVKTIPAHEELTVASLETLTPVARSANVVTTDSANNVLFHKLLKHRLQPFSISVPLNLKI